MKDVILLACLSGLFSTSAEAGLCHSKVAADMLCNCSVTGGIQCESDTALGEQKLKKKTPFDSIPDEVVESSLSYFDFSSLAALRGTSKACSTQVKGEFRKRQSQARIHQLIGKLVTVEAGAFEYLDDIVNPPVTLLVKVDHAFQMPENDVSQEQYDFIASKMTNMPTAAQAMNPDGKSPNFVGPKKPIGGLTEDQRQRYLARLNQSLALLWPVAYPGQSVPIMRLPEEREIRLAMSNPLPEGEHTLLADGIQMTAEFSTYSGTNVPVWGDLEVVQEQELNRYVVYSRAYAEGPKDVDDPLIQPNRRGFRGLSGNIWKPTSTLWSQNDVHRVRLGGLWCNLRQYCCSTLRFNVHPEDAFQSVGLRLSRTIP